MLSKISVAPMMDWTNRHCRYLHRLINHSALLYTEMITAQALKFGDRDRLLAYNAEEHPIALQLGGSDPDLMAQAAYWGEQAGYDEININIGCPSDRVQSGSFGACLMREPERVAECVAAMREKVRVPVTVKTRIGVDDDDSLAFLRVFVNRVVAAGCETLIIHARKAWLKGLSPKQNREIPPLNYERVYTLKQGVSELPVIINGAIKTLDEVRAHLQHVDGVMLGRKAYHEPYFLNALPGGTGRSCEEIVSIYKGYMARELEKGVSSLTLLKPLIGLYHGQPGARAWRRSISEKRVLTLPTV